MNSSKVYRQLLPWLCALVVVVGIGFIGAADAAQKILDDKEIGYAVDHELMVDPAVPANKIDVAVSDGIVTFCGHTV